MNKKKKKQIIIVVAIVILISIGGVFAIANLTGFSLFGEENTVIYYFNAYDEGGEEWAIDPDEMCDGDTGRLAVTNQPWQDPPEIAIQYLTANTCDGAELGTITKVEIRAKVDGPYSPPDINYVTLRPIFATGDGGNFEITVIGTIWSEWFDITTGTNAPSSWTWDNIKNLDCDVEGDVGLSFIKCAIVEIQVTFQTETPPPPTYNIAITILNSETYHGVSGAEVTIGDEMKHADGMGRVEFNLLEETHVVTIDRYDLVKSTEIITIPYHCPAITFYLNPVGDENGNGNGEAPPENGDEVPPSGTPGFEFMALIVAIGVAFICMRKRKSL